MAIKFLNNLETSTGSLTITKATTDPLLYLYNTTNGSGATIRFSDQSGGSQTGDITFYHSDGSSQGGGASWHFASQPDTVLVVGSSINNGRFVSKSAGSAGEVDYGFYDDVNTGMYRSAADTVRLVAGGVSGVNVSVNTVDLRYAGSIKLQTTSTGVDVTGTARMDTGITEGIHYVGTAVEHWGDGGTGMSFPANDTLSLRTASSDRLYINSTGNVGIGTTNPSAVLQVGEATGITGALSAKAKIVVDAANTTDINNVLNLISKYNGSPSAAAGSGPALLFSGGIGDAQTRTYAKIVGKYSGGNRGGLAFHTQDTADIITEKMTILPVSGNVGIGTTSPKQKLHVSGGTTAGDVTKMVIGATSGNAESYLYLAESFSGDNVNYGFAFVADGNSSNNLLFKRHSNSTSGTTVMEIRRDSDQIRFNGYSGTNQTGTPTYILGTDASGNVVKVLGSNIPTAAPATPSTITSTIVGETIEIAFNQSSTSNIDYYQVWSSDDGGDYGIIAQITPADFSSTMTVVDTTFVTGGTMSYRVFAVRGGIYSTAGTTSKAYTVSALSVTDMTVVNLNTAYYIQYEKPTSRFIDHVEIYMDSQTTSAALSRSNATIVYSGQNASYMRNVNTSSNFHQFWVEIVTS